MICTLRFRLGAFRKSTHRVKYCYVCGVAVGERVSVGCGCEGGLFLVGQCPDGLNVRVKTAEPLPRLAPSVAAGFSDVAASVDVACLCWNIAGIGV